MILLPKRISSPTAFIAASCMPGDHNSWFGLLLYIDVRPIVECNSVIWSPCQKPENEQIKKVQERFTKRLRGYWRIYHTV